MPQRTRSLRQEQRDLTAELRALDQCWAEVACAFREQYGVNARVAPRLAHGWSQRQAADRWNERWPADPKTFKNFSYWENWPSKTGYAPSLEVLARMAELYECHVSDLVADYADFRHRDRTHQARQHLAELHKLTDGLARSDSVSQTSTDLAAVMERLVELDVHDVAKLGGACVQQLDGRLDRRGLLLKLSAGLTLAAATSGLSHGDTGGDAIEAHAENGSVTGIWRSCYRYYSSRRQAELEGEHYVVLRQVAGRLVGQSLPHSSDSRLRLELSVNGAVVTGTWRERTSPSGHYAGATYHGTLQLLLDPMRRSMTGKWLGFGKDFNVNTGPWALAWVEGSVSRRAMREYYLKA